MSVPYTVVSQKSELPAYDLSIITVCRNVLPALKRTIASVIGQKAVYPGISIEHVIVDAASTDGTPEWLAGMKRLGHIETYVSEPDCGIYDAMNKGINLARGHVLLFLNADDSLTNVDLRPCIAPILEDKVRVSAATVALYDQQAIFLSKPKKNNMFISCPVCHQGYFAAASLYRELGGYRAELFPCMADRDIMYRAARLTGFPLVVDTIVSRMPAGGFSDACDYHFCDEKIHLLYNHRDLHFKKGTDDSQYCAMFVATVLNLCITLRPWVASHERDISQAFRELRELCLGIQDISHSRKAHIALQFAAGPYLSDLEQKKRCSLYRWFRIRQLRKRCDVSPDNLYYDCVGSFRLTLSSTLRHYWSKLVARL